MQILGTGFAIIFINLGQRQSGDMRCVQFYTLTRRHTLAYIYAYICVNIKIYVVQCVCMRENSGHI